MPNVCLYTILRKPKNVAERQNSTMGSPVLVTVANLVMEDVEQRALATTDVHPRFWKRYVDDTCTVLPADDVQRFLDHLSRVEPSIRFTVEVESDGKLPFLDVLLRHNPDGSVSTTVYRKPTHTDRYLDFASHHPLAHKIAVVRTLHSRAKTINSSVVGKDEETRHLRQALTANGYPKGVIQRHLTVQSARPVDRDDTQGPVITLPYVRGVSEAVRRILTPVGVRVSFRPHTTLRQLLSQPKDRVPEKELAGMVYQVPCAGCPATYVGQISRRLDLQHWCMAHTQWTYSICVRLRNATITKVYGAIHTAESCSVLAHTQ